MKKMEQKLYQTSVIEAKKVTCAYPVDPA